MFLIPKEKDQSAGSRAYLADWRTPDDSAWCSVSIGLNSMVAETCVPLYTNNAGKLAEDKMGLERISASLLRSIEGLASEEVKYHSDITPSPIIYVPIIVTNALLKVCVFDDDLVDLEKGHIDDATSEMTDVPYIKFQKTLSTTKPATVGVHSLIESAEQNQRTVIVTNQANIVDMLLNLQVNPF